MQRPCISSASVSFIRPSLPATTLPIKRRTDLMRLLHLSVWPRNYVEQHAVRKSVGLVLLMKDDISHIEGVTFVRISLELSQNIYKSQINTSAYRLTSLFLSLSLRSGVHPADLKGTSRFSIALAHQYKAHTYVIKIIIIILINAGFGCGCKTHACSKNTHPHSIYIQI